MFYFLAPGIGILKLTVFISKDFTYKYNYAPSVSTHSFYFIFGFHHQRCCSVDSNLMCNYAYIQLDNIETDIKIYKLVRVFDVFLA